MKMLRTLIVVLSVVQLVFGTLIINMPAVYASSQKLQSFDFSEGHVSTAVLPALPFDLHRPYRSMEGPYISFNFKPGDVVASKDVNLPEGLVTFVEGSNSAPAMM